VVLLKKWALALIGIAILAIILINLDIGKIVGILLGINLGLFLLAVVLDLLSAVLKAKKWQLLVNVQGRVLSFARATEYFFIGFFLSVLTPGRVGDLARALYLKRETKSLGGALSTVILDRLIDVVMLFSLGFIAIVSFAVLFGREIVSFEILMGLAVLLVAAGLVVLKKNFIGFFLKPFFSMFVPEKFKGALKMTFEDFYSYFGKIRASMGRLFAASGIGLVTWLLAFGSTYLFILALGIEVPIYFIPLLVPIIMLLDLLPISFSGIGTRDAAAIFLFGLYGVSPEAAVAFSFVFLLSGYWVVALVGAGLFMKNSISLDFGS